MFVSLSVTMHRDGERTELHARMISPHPYLREGGPTFIKSVWNLTCFCHVSVIWPLFLPELFFFPELPGYLFQENFKLFIFWSLYLTFLSFSTFPNCIDYSPLSLFSRAVCICTCKCVYQWLRYLLLNKSNIKIY